MGELYVAVIANLTGACDRMGDVWLNAGFEYRRKVESPLGYPPAADNHIVIVKYRRLSRRHRALGLIKRHNH